ncbi:DUF1013 domain-containing protein [Halovulum dunhuangense]|uniref:DUF1013 domain-containing protein n=1 Tax=Halovulum dunhuangense TaxID=1505036 RepID=A0A849L0A8_9RHOB|nr:cell cycle transcriptional regulator TrcR [Halovulum dunhuangense]NNU79697.1 DUF1013 domain-containing protein [Halovulum dunhuangense]
MALPLMQKATAVWLVDNTTLSFRQIAEFCGLHELEVNGIADGEVAVGIKGFDPIANNQLTAEEIARCEKDPKANLRLMHNPAADGESKRRGPRYTPLSKRQDRPAAIAWLVKFHPELADSQIGKLVGTTKPTIQSIRDRTHWNIANIQPIDPVALGLCRQSELDAAVAKAAKKAAATGQGMSDEARMKLVSTEQSLQMEDEPRLPSNIAGLETFTLGGNDKDDDNLDPDSLFNLPKGGRHDDEDDD